MTEYQAFVAGKAQSLLELMETIAIKDQGVAKLLNAMRGDLAKLIHGVEPMPSEILQGWSYYFSPDGPHGIDEKYPLLVDTHAELTWTLRRADMDEYIESLARLWPDKGKP